MIRALEKIQEVEVTSNTNSVTLTGIDNTYEFHQVVFTNVRVDAAKHMYVVFQNSGGDSSSTYGRGNLLLRSNTTHGDGRLALGTSPAALLTNLDTGNYSANCTINCFSFSNALTASFITYDSSHIESGNLHGYKAGIASSDTEANTGLKFYMQDAANMTAGKFTLYGLRAV